MALTDFSALDSTRKKLWSAYVWSAGRDTSFFLAPSNSFVSESTRDATKPIHMVTELTESERGAKCVMSLVQDLQNDGVVDDNDLENNEESMIVDDVEIQISQLRHGLKRKGRMSEQRTVIRFRAQAKDKLSYWYANKVDELLFLTAHGVSYGTKLDGSARTGSQWPTLAFAADVTAPSTNRRIFAGTATSTATLTASDKMTWNLLVKSKAAAARKRIKPIRIRGKDTYIVVMSSEQARDLRQDNDYKTIAAQADVRGDSNALFAGAFKMVEGLILFEHQKVYNTLGLASSSKWGAAGTVDGSQAVLLGAQALGFARIGEASWDESDNTDYGNRVGIAYSCMIGMLKPKYKSVFDANATEDFSTIAIYTAAAASV